MNAELTIPVKGMHCASCALTIQKTLRNADGVITCEVNYGNEKAKVEFDPKITSVEALSKKIEPFGYSLKKFENTHTMPDGTVMADHNMDDGSMKGIDHSAHLGLDQSKEDKLKELADQKSKVEFVMPITVLFFVLMLWEIASQQFSWVALFFLPHELFQIISLILSTLVIFWIGGPFLKEVVVFAKYRVANMYTLVGIGTLTAYLFSTIVVLFPPIKTILQLPNMVYYDVVIVVIGFIYLGKYLETRSKLRTGEAIEKLLNLQSKTAIVERDGKEIEIPVEEVLVDEIVIVKPGGKVPVDGVIIEGITSIDESMITGESMPVDKVVGDRVIGGTINKQGSFKFKTKKIGSETLLANIIKMVDEAQGSKAPIQGLADRISEVFVPTVLALSVAALLIWLIIGSQFIPFSDALSFGLMSFVGILVIACPCALGLATPTAIIVGTGKGAELGILIKNAESLEKLHKVDIIVTDKTGTITKGEPEITDIIKNYLSDRQADELGITNNDANSLDDQKILELLASMESKSEHPLAQAVVKKAEEMNIELLRVEDFENLEGKGIKGKIDNRLFYAGNLKLMIELGIKYDEKILDELTTQGKTPVFLSSETALLATIGIADTVKENAKETVDQLHELGIKVVMLTGDNANTAKYIADQVGIDYVIAEILPNEKADLIKALQNPSQNQDMLDKFRVSGFGSRQARPDKNVVAMVGDGVNDAPALSRADVGIAMGTGTDVAIESAEITLLRGDFSKVLQAIKLSKFTMQAIKQNLFWAFAYNILGIPLAAGILYPFFGILLNPIFAGLAMALSSVSVISNSLRLKTVKV